MSAINTIGKHIEFDYSITAYCCDCLHYARLDLTALGEKLGFDHPCDHKALTLRLRCSKCRAQNMTFTVSAGSSDRIEQHRAAKAVAAEKANAYARAKGE